MAKQCMVKYRSSCIDLHLYHQSQYRARQCLAKEEEKSNEDSEYFEKLTGLSTSVQSLSM